MKVPWIGFSVYVRKSVYRLLIASLLSLLFAGCTFLQLREEAEILQYSTILVGTVASDLYIQDTPIMVAAYTKDGNKRTIVHYTTLHEPGAYELIVPKGSYRLVAFENKNRNLIYDKGEPVGQYIGSEYVSAPAGGVISSLDIVISSLNTEKIDFPVGSALPLKKTNSFHNTSAGAIANLDDILFSAEYGTKGVWSPVEFYKEVGGNIYFLEEYDPKKIPILFVHGAGGSPQNWRAFFDSIDRGKYQPWFFYYPSGSSLVSMTNLLYWKLYNLQSKYKFNDLCITAHSMGGLVSRSFILNFGEVFPTITNFITISTPWGGEALAELGVKYSPAVVPSWKDMQPEGEFIQSLFREKMPPTIDFYLLFGHKGNRNILRPNNDNAVTLASQLDRRAQQEAKMIYGYDEDHVSILSSKQVLSQYNAILTAAYDKRNNAVQSPDNKLRVDFSFDFPKNRPRPKLALILRSADKNGFETLIYLNPDDTGREYGPFPSGNYEVSLVAPAFASTPANIPITIEEGSVPRAEFIMEPRGSLMGYIVNAGKSSLQAGEYRERNEELQIESITLKKNDNTRTITPHFDEMISFSDYYLSKTDFVAKGAFYFFDLPAGTYKLTINAKGYAQYSSMYQVRPGQYESEVVIELLK